MFVSSCPRPASDSQLSADDLVAAVLRGAAEQAAHMAEWLSRVAELDRREIWGEQGFNTCAHFLEVMAGVEGRTAREYVRVAGALEGLPLVRAAFSIGHVSYSKVRSVTRVATASNESFVLELAQSMSAAALDRSLAAYARSHADQLTLREDEARRDECGVTRFTDQHGLVHYEVIAAPEEAALIDKAIELGRDSVHRERKAAAPHGERVRRVGGAAGRLEGLVWAVRNGLANIARGVDVEDPYLVVVHVKEGESLVTDTGEIEVAPGLRLHPRTLQRLCCSSMIQMMLYGSDGERPLDLGRRARNATSKQRMAMRAMYATCAHPLGCSVPSERCVPHHVRWWGRDEGPTDLDNLVPLCTNHHWLVHEGGCRLVFGPDGRLVLIGRDGVARDGSPPMVAATDADALRRGLAARGVVPTGRSLGGEWARERWTPFARDVVYCALEDALDGVPGRHVSVLEPLHPPSLN